MPRKKKSKSKERPMPDIEARKKQRKVLNQRVKVKL